MTIQLTMVHLVKMQLGMPEIIWTRVQMVPTVVAFVEA